VDPKKGGAQAEPLKGTISANPDKTSRLSAFGGLRGQWMSMPFRDWFACARTRLVRKQWQSVR
jgi:hypothetical protein